MTISTDDAVGPDPVAGDMLGAAVLAELRCPESNVQRRTLRALADLATGAEPPVSHAVAELLLAVEGLPLSPRVAAQLAMTAEATGDERLLPTLVRLAQHPERRVRRAAAWALPPPVRHPAPSFAGCCSARQRHRGVHRASTL